MKWFTVSRLPRPKQLLHRRRVTCRLQLEALEDRCLLSSANGLVLTSTVTNITSGFDVANGLGLQSTGQIIVAGTANETGAQITNALGGSAGSQGAGTGLFAQPAVPGTAGVLGTSAAPALTGQPASVAGKRSTTRRPPATGVLAGARSLAGSAGGTAVIVASLALASVLVVAGADWLRTRGPASSTRV